MVHTFTNTPKAKNWLLKLIQWLGDMGIYKKISDILFDKGNELRLKIYIKRINLPSKIIKRLPFDGALRILLSKGRDTSCCFRIRVVCFRCLCVTWKLKDYLKIKKKLGSKQLIWNVTLDEIRSMLRAAFIKIFVYFIL